jgi:mono/diheme cytochrome c family protein
MFNKNLPGYIAIISLICSPLVIAGGADESKAADVNIKDQVLSNPDSVAQGNKKFHAICAYCHGSSGVGGKGKKLQGREFEPDFLFNRITEGFKGASTSMPSWSKLPEETRWQLVAYIMSLKDFGKK